MKTFSLSNILLLIAAIAAWLACYDLSSKITELRTEVGFFQQVSRELLVEDPTLTGLAYRSGDVHPEHQEWEIHVPEPEAGYTFAVCFCNKDAGNTLPDAHKLHPDEARIFPVQPGRHELSFQPGNSDLIELDDEKWMSVYPYQLILDRKHLGDIEMSQPALSLSIPVRSIYKPSDEPILLSPYEPWSPRGYTLWLQQVSLESEHPQSDD
ncbi:MAG: hypothetical protein AAF456_15345 [Planctomycetota bacterium]